jgi:hypothetical protein
MRDGLAAQLAAASGIASSRDGQVATALCQAAAIGCRRARRGRASRIVARLEGRATEPRIDTQYIVTEHGVCDIRGKSSNERDPTGARDLFLPAIGPAPLKTGAGR